MGGLKLGWIRFFEGLVFLILVISVWLVVVFLVRVWVKLCGVLVVWVFVLICDRGCVVFVVVIFFSL